jgi:predicted acylesterase/phospholipase RssA
LKRLRATQTVKRDSLSLARSLTRDERPTAQRWALQRSRLEFAGTMHTRFVRAAALALLCFALLVFSILGCSHVNEPLADIRLPQQQRERNHTRAALGAQLTLPAQQSNLQRETPIQPTTAPATRPLDHNDDDDDDDDDGYFIGLAISGGGSRSANFAAGCMFELQRLGILQRVDYISSVSGGSLTAAYYCLNDDAWNPQSVQEQLTQSFASDVIFEILMPWNVIPQLFTSWDRTDLLANTFRKKLFSRGGRALTFGDLRGDRPRLLINATDLQSGRRFVFCNESFDQLNSDLAAYPIANACAASAAVPVVMHHVTLRDYSTAFKQYVHLIDGGINDNLGIETLIETYYAQVRSAKARGEPDPYPRGAIFIVLDARTEFDAQLSDQADIGLVPGLMAGAGLTSTVLLNRISSATMSKLIIDYAQGSATADALRARIAELERNGYISVYDAEDKRVRVVHLALSGINQIRNVPFQSFGQRLNSIATYFNIDPTEAYNLYKASEILVRERFEPQLREIASELRAGE